MAFGDGRVVSSFIVQALRGEPLVVFGSGQQTRSFCYVDDLIEGVLRIAKLRSLDGPVNLGNPHESTVAELAELVLDITESTSSIDRRELPEDDPKQRCPDITRAKELIDFEPTTDLRTGLLRTTEDFRGRLEVVAANGGNPHRTPTESTPRP
jgi:UDP-glucuronate decarboxylase